VDEFSNQKRHVISAASCGKPSWGVKIVAGVFKLGAMVLLEGFLRWTDSWLDP
jgi:hypothetical protein